MCVVVNWVGVGGGGGGRELTSLSSSLQSIFFILKYKCKYPEEYRVKKHGRPKVSNVEEAGNNAAKPKRSSCNNRHINKQKL